MKQQMLDFWNFGILPEALAKERPVFTVTDLVWGEETAAVLRLCECTPRAGASDYENFYAICQAEPLLQGHPMPSRLSAFFYTCFGIKLSPTIENCDTIWARVADLLAIDPTLLFFRLAQEVCTPINVLTRKNELPRVLPQNTCPVLYANALFADKPISRKEWESNMQAVLNRFTEAGCQTVLCRLPKDFCDRRPDPFHVEEALQSDLEDTETRSLLWAQLLRFLSMECQNRGLSLMLEVDCDGREAVSCIGRIEREVGLPMLYWSTTRVDTRDAMLSFHAASTHKNKMRCALDVSAYPSRSELCEAVEALSARYPRSLLRFYSNTPLWCLPYERSRVMGEEALP